VRSGATQQSPTASPKVTVTVDSDVYTTEGAGGDERITKVRAGEEIWGGLYIIELDNSDDALVSKDYEGEDLTLNFGFTDEAGSDLHTLFVDRQRFISREGELLLQLICYDNWAKLSYFTANLGGSLWNYTHQSMTELNKVFLPSGEELPTDLKDAINAQYDQAVKDIVDKVLSDTLSKSTIGTGDSKYTSETPQVNAMDARNTIAQALSACMSYLRLDGSSFKVINMTSPSTAYSYNVANLFFENINGEAVIAPNTIIFHGMTSEGALVQTDTAGGHGVNAASVSKLGTIYEHHFMDWRDIGNLTTQAEVDDRADSRIARLEVGLSVGTLVAPMHCSQELFDKVSITDDRYGTPQTATGIVFGILREYDRGVYRVTLTLGGVEKGHTPDGGEDYKEGAEPDYSAIPEPNPPISMGAYIAHVVFTSTAYDKITWAAGTIEFRGVSKSVNASSIDYPGGLTLTATHYIYYIWGNPILQNSTSASDSVGNDRVLVAVVSKASTSAQLAYALNPYTDSILINTDKVMDGLVTELKLASEAVSTAKLQDSCIVAGKIAANAVTSQKIYAGAVTAVKIDVATLDAIAANVGTLTSGLINGVTAYFGGGKVICDSGGVEVRGSGKFKLASTTGSYRGQIYGDTTDQLAIDGNTRIRFLLNDVQKGMFGVSQFELSYLAKLGDIWGTGYLRIDDYVNFWYADYLKLPQRTSQPSAEDGALVYDSSDGHLKYYSAFDTSWFRVQRTGGWG